MINEPTKISNDYLLDISDYLKFERFRSRQGQEPSMHYDIIVIL